MNMFENEARATEAAAAEALYAALLLQAEEAAKAARTAAIKAGATSAGINAAAARAAVTVGVSSDDAVNLAFETASVDATAQAVGNGMSMEEIGAQMACIQVNNALGARM